MIHCVTAAVYYSSKVWDGAMPKKREIFLDKQVLMFFLLMSAVAVNVPFFVENGPSPTPTWFENLRNKIHKEFCLVGDVTPLQDPLSTITLLHVCHMEAHLKNATEIFKSAPQIQESLKELRETTSLDKLSKTAVIITKEKDSGGENKKQPLTASIDQYYKYLLADLKEVTIQLGNCYLFAQKQRVSNNAEDDEEEQGTTDIGQDEEEEDMEEEESDEDEEEVDSFFGDGEDNMAIEEGAGSTVQAKPTFIRSVHQLASCMKKNENLFNDLGCDAQVVMQSLSTFVGSMTDYLGTEGNDMKALSK